MKQLCLKSQRLMSRSAWPILKVTSYLSHVTKLPGSQLTTQMFQVLSTGSISIYWQHWLLLSLDLEQVKQHRVTLGRGKEEITGEKGQFHIWGGGSSPKSMMQPTSNSIDLSFVFSHLNALTIAAFNFLKHASLVAASSTRPPFRSEEEVRSPE